MQCLSSPSRAVVDRAHGQRKWLHNGAPNLKNFFFLEWRRRVLWILLLVTSLPIHLIYNSAVYSALGIDAYNIVLASANFDFSNPPQQDAAYENCFEQNVASNMSSFYAAMPKFENLTTQKCLDTYAVNYIAGRGTLVLVTSDQAIPSGR
ncbi:unnamed protein product [Penicillium viridicatum]